MRIRFKEIQKNLPNNDKFYGFLRFLNVIVTSDYEIPFTNKNLRYTARILRNLYAIIIATFIILSFTTFVFLKKNTQFNKSIVSVLEIITFVILLSDILLRQITYVIRDPKKSTFKIALLRFYLTSTFWIMFICLLPSFSLINVWSGKEIKIFEIFGTLKILRILRLMMLLSIFSSFKMMSQSLKKQKSIIISAFIFILVILILFSLTIWYSEYQFVLKELNLSEGINSVENQNKINEFYLQNQNLVSNFWDSLYFTAITLTTIGYGDFVPHAEMTKMIIPIISLIGIAIISLPGGLFATALLDSLQNRKKVNKNTNANDVSKEQETVKTIDLNDEALKKLIDQEVVKKLNEILSKLNDNNQSSTK